MCFCYVCGNVSLMRGIWGSVFDSSRGDFGLRVGKGKQMGTYLNPGNSGFEKISDGYIKINIPILDLKDINMYYRLYTLELKKIGT